MGNTKMKKAALLLGIFFIAFVGSAIAQHDMNNMPGMHHEPAKKKPVKKAPIVKKTATVKSPDTTTPRVAPIVHDHGMENMKDDHSMPGMDMSGEMDDHEHSGMGSMSHGFSLNLPMSRNGSGTSWAPDAAPMYGYMLHSGKWMFMFHGDVFIRYNSQDITNKGSRGGNKFDAPDMLMAMGQRKIGNKGLFHFSAMLSTDALIAGGSGYPLLFQTGETWQSKPLIDRQHPHDLFSELSVSYAYAFSKKADIFAYIGYPGEPALGPTTFMHRPSGMFNPDAPISHHWVDATHITFGVATIGLRYSKFKIEGSSFTGREPNENRYDFDKPRFDSWSGRLSFNPGKNWALQVSHGFIKSPEQLHAAEDVNRTTASATYSYQIAKNNFFSATALWGLNKIAGEKNSNAALLEANLKLKRSGIYARYEWVQKSGEELVLNGTAYNLHSMFPINAITLGYAYDILTVAKLRFAPGAQFTLYHADGRLDNLYGKNPLAGEIYLHIYPGLMQ